MSLYDNLILYIIKSYVISIKTHDTLLYDVICGDMDLNPLEVLVPRGMEVQVF